MKTVDGLTTCAGEVAERQRETNLGKAAKQATRSGTGGNATTTPTSTTNAEGRHC